jgi:4-hydroxy-3-polyprenylbenzoate decarboxylase
MPTLYNQPRSTDQMAREFCFRVLGFVGLRQPGAFVWTGE